jgi:hypothetical protein
MRRRGAQALNKKIDASNSNQASIYREFIQQVYNLDPELEAKLATYSQTTINQLHHILFK